MMRSFQPKINPLIAGEPKMKMESVLLSLIAPRMDRIKPSPSSAVTQRARELRAAGRDVISLSVGEPDFPTPEHICQGAVEAMKRGQTRYTTVDGTPELKQAIIGKFKRENGLEYKPDQITVGNGAKQVIFNAMMATLAPGDEVVIPAPHWVSYTDITLLAEGVPVVVPCPQSQGFKLRAEALEAAITSRTKWIILNSPCNPTGAVYSRPELQSLIEVLLRYPQVHVLTDDIYEHILFDDRQFFTPAQVEPELYERTLTVNGVSKAYAMPGWRIGYAGGPRALIKAIAKLQGQSTTNPCSISQAAAVVALNGPQDFIPERAAAFQQRRDRVLELLNRVPGLSCHKPEGAFYLYPDCSGLMGKRRPDGRRLENDQDFAMYLLDCADVAVVQGSAYNLSPYVRISIATSMELLEQACARIHRACAELS
jgi:aspartate aminotransferase